MPKRKSAEPYYDSISLPGHAKILAEIGPETAKVTASIHELIQGSSLLTSQLKETPFPSLSDSLRGWEDKEAAAVLRALQEQLQEGREIDLPALSRWIRAHRSDAGAVIDCLAADPPEEITILQLLSRAGSQKLVFLANWQIAQREVVLKRFIRKEAAEELIARELQPHPLSMEHPNIIETHLLRNRKGERFLVEKRLQVVLSDLWRSHGVAEAANLLRDIASALSFLQDKQLVHGDIKPDNIGFEDGRYILLDFGICRPEGTFAETSTPTGSLRTRAPELLQGSDSLKHSYASDLWALGATVYNAVTGRFPLFDSNEKAPRVSHPSERGEFEAKLEQRVANEWKKRVDLSIVPEPLRDILGMMLRQESKSRPPVKEVVESCENELAAFLRTSEGSSRFSPAEEVKQLKAYLPDARTLALMPSSQKHALKSRLQSLKGYKGLNEVQMKDIDVLERLLA